MNKTAGLWIRLALALPLVLVSYLIVAIVRAAWGEKLWWDRGVLFTRLRADSWPARTWYRGWGGTTFGHAVMLGPNADNFTVAHELVHVEQFEANAIVGLLAALAVVGWSWWMAIFLWVAVPYLSYVASLAVAWLRGESTYSGSHLEEAARDAVKRP